MLVSSLNRDTLPNLWSNPMCHVAGARRPGRGMAAQPAYFYLLRRNHSAEPLCCAVLLFRFPSLRLANLPSKVKRALGALVMIALAANWVYLLAHR